MELAFLYTLTRSHIPRRVLLEELSGFLKALSVAQRFLRLGRFSLELLGCRVVWRLSSFSQHELG
jgi:hypothetical protein